MKLLRNKMEFSSAIYRGDPCPEFSFSFKFVLFSVLFPKKIPAKQNQVIIPVLLCRAQYFCNILP